MKLNKVLCLFLMLAVVFSFASCGLFRSKTVTHTVTFDSNGGSAVASQSVEEGKLAAKPTDPTKDGYTFAGWYLGTEEWDFAADAVNKDITLVAAWEKVDTPDTPVTPDEPDTPDVETYTITYMDGTTVLNLAPGSITSNSASVSLPTAEKAHYNFAGWYTEAELVNKVTSISGQIGADVTLYAGFTAKTYTITYVLDGGVNADANPASYTIENLPTSFAPATKAGFDFTGWYSDTACTKLVTEVTAETAGNLYLYAGWEVEYVEPTTYTITYKTADGTVITGLTPATYQKSSENIALPTYSVDGYSFLGWLDADTNAAVPYIAANTEGDRVLVANLAKDVVILNLNYVINGTTYHTASFNAENGVAELLVPTKVGYTFDGWYDANNNKVASIPAGATADVTLTGTWTAITYTITYFDGETQLPLTPAEYTVSESDIILPDAPTKTDHIFLGWYDANGNKVTKIAAGSVGNLVLTAEYGEIKYTVEYMLDGGVNNENNQTSFKPNEIPALYDADSRDGFLFAGWYTTVDFSGEAVTSFLDVITDGQYTITLYAKWVPVSDDNGGGSTLTPEVPW